jgi:hypothetical protein
MVLSIRFNHLELTINGLSVFVRAGRWEAFWAAGHGLRVG